MDDTSSKDLPKDVLAPAEGPRENLVATAVKFLQNPKVQGSPLYQKEAFLEKKGLTKEEIQLAVQRAGVSSNSSLTQQQHLQQPPPTYTNGALLPGHMAVPAALPLSPWTRARDIGLTTAFILTVSYAVYKVFKGYIQPWLTKTSETEKRLQIFESSIASLHELISESNARILETLRGIQETLSMQGDRSRLSTDMSLRPDPLALSEIKSEISSVKGLLLNRRQFPPVPNTSPIIPAWQRSSVREDLTELTPLKTESGQPESCIDVSDGGTKQQALLANVPAVDNIQKIPSASHTSPSSIDSSDSDPNSLSQTVNTGVTPSESTSVITLPSQTESDSLSAIQTTSCTNGFEMVKPNSDSN